MKRFAHLSTSRKVIALVAFVLFLFCSALLAYIALTIPPETAVFYVNESGQDVLYQTLKAEPTPATRFCVIGFGVGAAACLVALGCSLLYKKRN